MDARYSYMQNVGTSQYFGYPGQLHDHQAALGSSDQIKGRAMRPCEVVVRVLKMGFIEHSRYNCPSARSHFHT